MPKQNKFNLNKLASKVKTAEQKAIVIIGNEARNFFVENFRKQGFDDRTVEKWQPRKRSDKKPGRAILVKSGDLPRSIIRRPPNKANLIVKITSDLKYARRHNEGIKMPKRRFIGDSFNLNEKMKKILINQLNNAISTL